MKRKNVLILAIIAILVIIVVSIVFSAISNGKKVHCFFCEEEFFEKQGETRDIEGEIIYICPDCYAYITGGLEDPGTTTTTTNTTTTTKNNQGSQDPPEDPPHVHTEVIDLAVDATCTNTGLTEGKHCSVCNTVTVEQIEIDPKGHSTIILPEQAATCEQTGLTYGEYCTVCNETLVEQEIIPPIDCIENGEIIDKEATLSEDGSIHTECTMCGKTVNEYIIGAGSQGLIYEELDDGTYAVVDIGSCNDENLIIPQIYYNEPITTIGDSAFLNESITSITIPVTVTKIGDDAFLWCDYLETIYFNGTIEQWKAIDKGNVFSGWVKPIVQCSNGTIQT